MSHTQHTLTHTHDEANNARLIAAAVPEYARAADEAVLAIMTVKNFLLDLADVAGIDDNRRKEVYRQIDVANGFLIAAIAKAEGGAK